VNALTKSRLLFHKFDPLTPAPGGIDTCIRGIIKYSDHDEELYVLGVDGRNDPTRELGRWESHNLDGRNIRFMPVTRLDPGNQVRRIPHSVRIAIGAVRYVRRVPRTTFTQSHRADLGALTKALWPTRAHYYFIHTQESGILGKDSDSFWKRAASLHRRVEKLVVRSAAQVRVFNPTYAPIVAKWNANTQFSPTWWDPELIRPPRDSRTHGRLLWVGRLEQPKVPSLAIHALARLVEQSPDTDWHLTMVGTGNLAEELQTLVGTERLGDRVTFTGRLQPDDVMTQMADSAVLLMTSVVGYEGFPRVLVEGLASGLSAVVTHGADTGNLVSDGVNGYRVQPEPAAFADRIEQAENLSPTDSRESVRHLAAPHVVGALYSS
jgi:glycosyltransferase involved in cell wall biosynthesis